jgi:Rrf2 family iron-sulfur cluster assembly transcriptional regulator
MLLSKSCEYGLRAMLYLASLGDEGADGAGADEAPDPTREYVSIGAVSDELGIGFSFLTKVFQQLNDAGLLISKRGPGGGVALTRPPEQVPLYDIIVAIDGDDLFEECVLGLPGCGEAEPCPLHDHWTEARGQLETTFRNTTLAEVPDVRLTPFIEDADGPLPNAS